MKLTIDSHAHVFPNFLMADLNQIKSPIRKILSPWIEKAHRAQSYLRVLPQPARLVAEEVATWIPLSGLLIESVREDLLFSMARSMVDKTVIISHLPFISNEFVLELAQENPAFIPVVSISQKTKKIGKEVKRLKDLGARAIKIHAASDGLGPESQHYHSIIRSAIEADLPIVLHTGCFHSSVFYRKPKFGDVNQFEPWFEAYPENRFILAHMNFDSPRNAIELAEKYSNLLLETSWQPSEIIGEAVRKVGASRVMMGSDWPYLGRNQDVAVKRVYEAADLGWLNSEELEQVLGKTAAKEFKVRDA